MVNWAHSNFYSRCSWRWASCWWCQRSPRPSWRWGSRPGRTLSASSGCRETLGLWTSRRPLESRTNTSNNFHSTCLSCNSIRNSNKMNKPIFKQVKNLTASVFQIIKKNVFMKNTSWSENFVRFWVCCFCLFSQEIGVPGLASRCEHC